MRSYDDTPLDTSDSVDPEREKRSKLPGGISVQTAAAGLIILVVVGLLWLLALPEPEPPEASATGTPGSPVGTMAAGLAVTATQRGALGGTPVVGSLAATRAATSSLAQTTPLVQGGALPTLASAPGVTPQATIAPAPASQLAEGAFARITGTGIEGIRFRFGPGLEFATIRIAEEGEDMLILEGPQAADGFEWWRLQDSFGNVGWAASQFLAVVAAPAVWSPPAASPTFEAGLPTP